MIFWRILYSNGLKLSVLIMSLVACSGGGGSDGGSVMLSWMAPSGRADNVTPIALNEIAGYNIYYKIATGNYSDQAPIYVDDSNNVANVQVRVEDIPLQPGTYSVVVTTIDIDGRESVFSDPEVEVTF
ncbi:MAG: hypothetical protein GXP11_09665 [Gammaproteobacteria bacterium]|nr:hypothetical protein [Gammaproteobacteria bacterium]